MLHYLLQNRKKLLAQFLWFVLPLSGVSSVVFYVREPPESLIAILLGAFIPLVLFVPISALVIVWTFLENYLKYHRTNKLFSATPLQNLLLSEGFRVKQIEPSSNWSLSELILEGPFGGFQLIGEVERRRFRFIAKSNYEHLDEWDDDRFESILHLFEHVNFEFDGRGIATTMKVSALQEMTSDDLTAYLKDFIKLQEQLKITPERPTPD